MDPDADPDLDQDRNCGPSEPAMVAGLELRGRCLRAPVMEVLNKPPHGKCTSCPRAAAPSGIGGGPSTLL